MSTKKTPDQCSDRGFSFRMEMHSSARRGAPRRHMEGASNDEVYHRVGLLLNFRHGHAREVNDRKGTRPIDQENENEALRRLPEHRRGQKGEERPQELGPHSLQATQSRVVHIARLSAGFRMRGCARPREMQTQCNLSDEKVKTARLLDADAARLDVERKDGDREPEGVQRSTEALHPDRREGRWTRE